MRDRFQFTLVYERIGYKFLLMVLFFLFYTLSNAQISAIGEPEPTYTSISAVTGITACAFDEVFATQNDGEATFNGVLVGTGCGTTTSFTTDCKDATVVKLEIAISGDVDLRLTSRETGTCTFKDIDFALFGPYADESALDNAVFPGGTFAWPSSSQIDCGNNSQSAKPSFGDSNEQQPETPYISGAVASEYYALVLCNSKGFDQDVTIGQAWNSAGSICGGSPMLCPTPAIYMGSGIEVGTNAVIDNFIGDAAAFCAGSSCPVSTSAPSGAICSLVLDCNDTFDCVDYDQVAPSNSFYTQYWGPCNLSVAQKDEFMFCPGGLAATDQGYVSQMFCSFDADGYPQIPSSFHPSLPEVSTLTNYVSNTTEVGNWLGGTCVEADDFVKKVPEAVQLDYWVFVPCSCSSLGFKITGGSFDAGLIYTGTEYNNMQAVAEYVNIDGVEFLGSATQIGYYTPTVPCTATESGDGGRFLRVRQYITDINQQFIVDAQVDIGQGFTDITALVAVAATSPSDAIKPTNTVSSSSGFQDSQGNVFDANGDWVPTAHNIVVTTAGCVFTDCPQITPVEMLNFEVTNASMKNTLEWATISEINNFGFELLRRTDRSDYEVIAMIYADSPNSDKLREYTYVDEVNTSGIYYYKLKQIDLDNSFEFSDIISVNVGVEPKSVAVYPNPSTNNLNINFEGSSFYNSKVNIEVFDRTGRLLITRTAHKNKVVESLAIDHLINGLYYIRIYNNAETTIKTFVKL